MGRRACTPGTERPQACQAPQINVTMNAIALGPVLLSLDRLAVVLGFVVAFLFAEALTRRVDPRFSLWSYLAAGAALVGGRLGHVLENPDTFAATPWRVLAIWQGGFSAAWAVLPVIFVTSVLLPRPRLAAWGLVAICAGVLTWGIIDGLTTKTTPARLPHITLQTLEGSPVSLADTAGKPTVINIWATWCPPCRSEMPLLAKAAQEHQDVRFLFINQGETPQRIKAYLRDEDLDLSTLAIDRDLAVSRHFATVGVPVTLFFTADGRLASHHTGEISPEQLRSKLATARR